MDRAIADLASAQYGVVSLPQLTRLGLTRDAVRARVRARKLHPLHRGVYAVGHRVVPRHGHWVAAVLACGPGAVLSHRSAAALWGLIASNRTHVDVTTPRRTAKSRTGIDLHRTQCLHPTETTTHDRIPTTTVARTLLDIAATTNARTLERALDQAEILRVLDVRALTTTLERAGKRPGTRLLKAVLDQHAPGTTLTRSELEERFLAVCRAAKLPRPRVNEWLALDTGDELQPDFHWPDQRLIVETDSQTFHHTRRAFEGDRRRDQTLTRNGWRVIRATHTQLTREPDRIAALLRDLLSGEGETVSEP